MKKFYLFIFFIVLWMFPVCVFAEEVHMYLFYGNTCPICERERDYLKSILSSNPNVRLFEFETYDHLENDVNMQQVKEMYHIRGEGVPFLVVGDIAIYGFGEATPAKIESAIRKQTKQDYYDRVGVYLGMFEDTLIEEDSEVEISISDVHDDSLKEKEQKKSLDWKVIFWLLSFLTLLVVTCVYGLSIFSRK